MGPQGDVEVGDIAKPDQRLRIGAHGVEIDPVDDPVRASTATSRDDRPHRRVTERVVQVGETLLVPAGHVTPFVHHVSTEVDAQAPAFQHLDRLGQPRAIRGTRRRHQPDQITTAQHRSPNRFVSHQPSLPDPTPATDSRGDHKSV